MKKSILYFILFATVLVSCNNDDNNITTDDTTEKTGTLKLMFQSFAGHDELALNTNYLTENNDTISVSVLQYFLSNFMISDTMGMSEMEIDSYHLIKTETDGEMTMWEWEVPANVYKSLNFSFGVDSTVNHSTANAVGDLDPSGADGMTWNWNTGYKFLRFEGTYNTDTTTNGAFLFHLGGDANYRNLTLGETMDMHMKTASETLFTIEENKTTTLHISANILNLFANPNLVDLDVTNTAHHSGSQLSENIAEDVFMIHHMMME